MKTVTEVKIANTLVEIKSKRDKDAPSGWSVIAFTPACSIRCTRAHDWEWLSNFVCAIIAGAGAKRDVPAFKAVSDAILSITDLDPK
jgi:hypothetical protein|tara:strand:+ start:2683 stop:2943 length:261 start_codon:yes stop_codon:yes gene_type:complete